MAEVRGTLWFGTDIEDGALKKAQTLRAQIEQEFSKGVTVKVSKESLSSIRKDIRDELKKETFTIQTKLDTKNVEAVAKSAMTSVSTSAESLSAGFQKATSEVQALTEKIIAQRDAVREVVAEVGNLKSAWSGVRGIFDNRTATTNQREHINNTRELGKELDNNVKFYGKLNSQMQSTIGISGELGTIFASLYSVQKAKDFLEAVVQIGGQLEKQRLSMGAILKDTAHANVLFGQLKDLALKSPFGVVELDQYSKQLAAYGFQYNELYDMTKRLADISAGAGQDIGRLALALGHVRSATYLTGMTLRQFSMNNIPMLSELSKLYTELEGKMVSVADVQKRISNKEVGYEDVIEVIRRMTDEGGMFYKMQETIAESVAAKWKNLGDAIDIMYGEMAESGVGDLLKSTATALTALARQWETILPLLAAAVTQFGFLKVAQMLFNTGLKRLQLTSVAYGQSLKALTAEQVKARLESGMLSKQQILYAVATKKLTIEQAQLAMAEVGVTKAQLTQIRTMGAAEVRMLALRNAARALSMSLKALALNPFTWVFVGVEALVTILSKVNQKAEETQDAINQMQETAEEGSKALAAEDLKFEVGASKNLGEDELKQAIERMKEALRNYSNDAGRIINGATFTDETHENVRSLADQYESLASSLAEVRDAYDLASESADAFVNANDSTDGFLDESFKDNIEDWIEALENQKKAEVEVMRNRQEVITALKDTYIIPKDAKLTVDELIEKLNNLTDAEKRMIRNSQHKDLFKDFFAAMRDTETARIHWMEEVKTFTTSAIDNLENAWGVTYDNWTDKHITSTKQQLTSWLGTSKGITAEQMQEVEGEIYKVANGLVNWFKQNPFEISVKTDDAKETVSEFQRYLQSVVGKDYIVTLQLQTKKNIADTADDLEKKAKELKGKIESLDLTKEEDNLARSYTTSANDSFKVKEAHDYYMQLEAIKGTAKGLNIQLDALTDKNDKAKDTSKKAADALYTQWNNDYQALKKLNKEYENYFKTFGEDAFEKIQGTHQFDDLMKKFGINKENIDDAIGHLKKLQKNIAATSEQRRKLVQNIGADIVEIEYKNSEESIKAATDELTRKMDESLKNWDIYKKWKDVTGNKELSMKVAFGAVIDADNVIEDLKNQINDALKKGSVKSNNNLTWEDIIDFNEEQLKSLGEGGRYIALIQKLQSAMLKFKETTAETLLSVYKDSLTFEDKINNLEATLKVKLEAIDASDMSESEKKKLRDHLIDNYNKELSKLQFEQFKESNNWVEIFDDLDRVSTKTLNDMIKKVEEFARTGTKDVKVVKELMSALQKMRKETTERNPFGTLGALLKERAKLNKGIEDEREKEENNRKWKSDFTAALQQAINKLQQWTKAIDMVANMFDALGNEGMSQGLSNISSVFGGALNGASSLSGLGPWGMAAGGALGFITSIAQLHDKQLQKEIEASQARMKLIEYTYENLERALGRVMGGIYRFGDTQASKEQQVAFAERVKPYLEEFAKARKTEQFYKEKYGIEVNVDSISEELKDAIEEALNTGTFFDEQLAALKLQKYELEQQAELEDEKKKSDSEKIADLQQQIAELDDQIRHYAEDLAKSLFDIDFKNFSDQLAQSLVDAWEKGEDAALAYKKTVSDILKSVATNVIAQKYLETALEPLMNQFLDQYTMDKGMVTEQGMSILAQMYDKASEMDDAVRAYLDSIERVAQEHGTSLKDTGETSGGLSAGIKNITEETADLLASYVNAIRAYTAMDNMMLTQLMNEHIPQMNAIAEAQLVQLNVIADNTGISATNVEEIYALLSAFANGTRKLSVQ